MEISLSFSVSQITDYKMQTILSWVTHHVSQNCGIPLKSHSKLHRPWFVCSVTNTTFVPGLKWRLLGLSNGHWMRFTGSPPSGPKTSIKPDPQWATNKLPCSSKSIPSGPSPHPASWKVIYMRSLFQAVKSLWIQIQK